ncbi:MAG: YraN family protein [Candidatus Aminicenantia bacterium]
MWKKKAESNKLAPHQLGREGEILAAKYLKKKRYHIVEKGFKALGGEIDLIAYDGDTLVFIEVKTRKSLEFGFPQEAVTPQKQEQLRKIAQGYLMKNNLNNIKCRFDVLGILFSETKEPEIFHIKNAF